MAGFGRIVLVGVTLAVGLGTMALRAQTALEDPKNAQKIFANTCSACHKSPQGLAKNGSASFLRQHYTTGPEMSNAMAAYLASNGRGEAPRKNEKKEPTTSTAAKATPNQKQASHPLTDGTTDVQRPPGRDKNDKKAAKLNEPKRGTEPAVRPVEPPPAVVDRAVPPPSATQPPASSTAALSTPPAPAARAPESSAAPGTTLDIPMPEFPTGPPADLTQPSAFSSAPLP